MAKLTRSNSLSALAEGQPSGTEAVEVPLLPTIDGAGGVDGTQIRMLFHADLVCRIGPSGA